MPFLLPTRSKRASQARQFLTETVQGDHQSTEPQCAHPSRRVMNLPSTYIFSTRVLSRSTLLSSTTRILSQPQRSSRSRLTRSLVTNSIRPCSTTESFQCWRRKLLRRHCPTSRTLWLWVAEMFEPLPRHLFFLAQQTQLTCALSEPPPVFEHQRRPEVHPADCDRTEKSLHGDCRLELRPSSLLGSRQSIAPNRSTGCWIPLAPEKTIRPISQLGGWSHQKQERPPPARSILQEIASRQPAEHTR